jgi:hypothetical protein
MVATKTLLIAGTTLALAMAALPAAAEDDPQGADCFFAENRDDPLCRETVVAVVAPLRRPAAPLQQPVAPLRQAVAPRKYAPTQDDGESVDCFFAENRELPLCRDAQ